MDSDVRTLEGNVSLGELPIVMRAFVGGATESETGVGRFHKGQMYVEYDPKCIKIVVCFSWK